MNNTMQGCKCLAEILTVIEILQEKSEHADNCLDTCDRGFLGTSANSKLFNTRPIILYGCNGEMWEMPISKDPNEKTTSNIFRIEKIDGCCATFRVLEKGRNSNDNDNDNDITYLTTNSFVTFNLDCICAIRCLRDTYVDCI